MTDLAFASIEDLATRYRDGEVSPVEATGQLLARIDALDSGLNAFITVAADSALAEAERAAAELRAGTDRGPLHGVPVALKDLIDTAGVRTTCGSRIRADHVPERDAPAVARLREAGAVILGKTNMLEFAYGVVHPDYGDTRNPWDPARTAGGSSGGSAAAVAAGLCFAAFGTDTGGSIRVPASYCGVVGMKPSYGLVDLAGVFPLSWSLDHGGPLARSCADARLLLEAMCGRSLAADVDLAGVRFGVIGDYLWTVEHEPAVREAFETACDALRGAGAQVVEVEAPVTHECVGLLMDLLLPEASVVHERDYRERPDDYAPDTLRQLGLGFEVPATRYVKAQRRRAEVIRLFRGVFERVDALLSPAVPWLPPSHDPNVIEGEGVAELHHSGPFNVLGLPALSVPCALASGLPVGLQIVADSGLDGYLLALGAAFERVAPGARANPEGV